MDAFRIRVLLVADQSVRQHHNSRDEAENYLLAIMNIVSGMVEIVCVCSLVLYPRQQSKQELHVWY